MKIAVHITRTLLGLLFLWASIAYFGNLVQPKEPLPVALLTYMQGISQVKLLTFVKTIELVCGVLLLVNILAPLANLLLFPITVNILLVHTFIDPNGILAAVAIIAIQLFLIYAYRKNYAGLLSIKPL